MVEFADFQINQNMAFQNTMIENQVDTVVSVVECDSFLASGENGAFPPTLIG